MIKKNGVLLISYLLIVGIFYSGGFCERGLASMLPVLAYIHTEEPMTVLWTQESLESLFPVLQGEKMQDIIAKREDYFNLKKLKPVELLTMMGLENGAEDTTLSSEKEVSQTPSPVQILDTAEDKTESIQPTGDSQEVVQEVFVPHALQTKVDMSLLDDYETLLKSFYTIDTCAMVGSNLLDAGELADVDLRITKNIDEPQILIYHTHSQEGYVDSVPGDDTTTIVGVGEHLAQILHEEYGYNVMHHLGKYDEESRNNAYSRALPDIVQILQEYPSIEVIIDLHRDAVDESYKLVTDLDGQSTARFMFFNGVSCTKNTGSISYLENPYQMENLAFSFQMKKVAEEYYPGLTRKNYIHGYRYNMHLLPRTTLIELGAQNNTVKEAMNACYPIAHILDMVLTGA